MSEEVVVDAREWLYSIGAIYELAGLAPMGKPTEKVLDDVYAKAIQYPPPPELPTYRRTYFMENGWRGRLILKGDDLAEFDNRGVDYVRLVMDEKDQAAIHKSRWRNMTIQAINQRTAKDVAPVYAKFSADFFNPKGKV